MAREEQAFRATYTYEYNDAPKIDRLGKSEDSYLDCIHPVTKEMVRIEASDSVLKVALDDLGIDYVEITSEKSYATRVTDPDFLNEGTAISTELDEPDNVASYNRWSTFTVETVSVRGMVEHKKRRAKIEAFFRKWNISFTLECQTLHSASVCSPIIKDTDKDELDQAVELMESPQ